MSKPAKVDPYAHIAEPPSRPVRWQVSCSEYQRASREEKGTIARSASVIVEAQTWSQARADAFRHFAAVDHIYEPEDVTAFVLRDAMPVTPASAPDVVAKKTPRSRKKEESSP